ncbi:MAG: hypothetical protein LUO95_11710 [Methylococcaceae bacterium]|nr:hypothetical protein [Methylococcaceae bacterium]
MFRITTLDLFCLAFSSLTIANEGEYEHHGYHQGLAGGVIGSVLGYELRAGYPIASGLGVAAGLYLRNGLAR